jgi:hypothetical protein
LRRAQDSGPAAVTGFTLKNETVMVPERPAKLKPLPQIEAMAAVD